MTQLRKTAGSAGGTGGQFEHDPKAGTTDLPGLGAPHTEPARNTTREQTQTLHLAHTGMNGRRLAGHPQPARRPLTKTEKRPRPDIPGQGRFSIIRRVSR